MILHAVIFRWLGTVLVLRDERSEFGFVSSWLYGGSLWGLFWLLQGALEMLNRIATPFS